jgi:hypothetical protein
VGEGRRDGDVGAGRGRGDRLVGGRGWRGLAKQRLAVGGAVTQPVLGGVGGAADAVSIDAETVRDVVEVNIGDRSGELLGERAEAIFKTVIGHVCNGDSGEAATQSVTAPAPRTRMMFHRIPHNVARARARTSPCR